MKIADGDEIRYEANPRNLVVDNFRNEEKRGLLVDRIVISNRRSRSEDQQQRP
jgi:hypothetical protein